MQISPAVQSTGSPVHYGTNHGLQSPRWTISSPGSFKPLLDKLVQTPEDFALDDLKLALTHLFTPDAVLPAQIGAFLAALHIHRGERRPESLAVAASILRDRALKAVVEGYDSNLVVDIVGTAAIVAAGAGGRVIKVSLRLLSILHALMAKPDSTAVELLPFL